jgi:hypothetical protein
MRAVDVADEIVFWLPHGERGALHHHIKATFTHLQAQLFIRQLDKQLYLVF